jgi:hypothetical protein
MWLVHKHAALAEQIKGIFVANVGIKDFVPLRKFFIRAREAGI